MPYLAWFSFASALRPLGEGSGILLGVEEELVDLDDRVDALSPLLDVELLEDEEVVERNLSVWDLRTRENMMKVRVVSIVDRS